VPPSQFIQLAEMSDIIHPLTDWVMERALMQLRDWRGQGRQTSIAINVSPRNLLNEQFPNSLQRLLRQYRIPPEALQLEITENALITDPEQALATLQRIRALGVKLAIDDFGTGYSSLTYLKRLPVDTLKIDISFTSQMLDNHVDAMIVRSTINLAHNLGLQVVAEGVEDAATLAALHAIGCDEAQGYHIARPLPAEQATEYLAFGQPLPL
jgi:EAL domain-containing protein (putative c-di-GMP-specific phosphodiesterase class I)